MNDFEMSGQVSGVKKGVKKSENCLQPIFEGLVNSIEANANNIYIYIINKKIYLIQ